MGLQRLGQRGLQGLDRGGASGRRGRGEGGQGRLSSLEALDKGTLSSANLGHGAAEVGTLALKVLHGPLQAGLTAGQRGGWAAREVC